MDKDRKVHCEITGKDVSLTDIKIMTRFDALINPRLMQNPRIDYSQRIIYSKNCQPVHYYKKVEMSNTLAEKYGELFMLVDFDKEAEESVHIIDASINDKAMEGRLKLLEPVLKTRILIKFPINMFLALPSDTILRKEMKAVCENWGVEYYQCGKKYFYRKILNEKIVELKCNEPVITEKEANIGITTWNEKNPYYQIYNYKTSKEFISVNLCCNESAIDFCKRNNVIVYYIDFVENGNLRFFVKETEEINRQLGNSNLFKSLHL